MAKYLSTEQTGSANQTSVPSGYKGNAFSIGGHYRRIRATFTLASQTTSDTLSCGFLPAGAVFAGICKTTSVSLGSSTLAFGNSGTAAKYQAAATFTATDTPTFSGIATQMAGNPLSAPEEIIATIAAANLPSSGTLVVEVLYTMP